MDKVLLPGSPRSGNGCATLVGFIAVGEWCAPQTPPSSRPSAQLRTGARTHNHKCKRLELDGAPAFVQSATVVMSPGRASLAQDDGDQRSTNAFSITKWPGVLP